MRKLLTTDARRDRSWGHRAFTLLDLIVALAVLAILAATFAPALAKSGGKAARINCFNNKRHIAAACAMYSAEFNDWLVPNGVGNGTDPFTGAVVGWCIGQEDWGTSQYNTNVAAYKAGLLGPYVNNINVYKCPNDKIPSDNGDRIRSISMNGAICGDLPASSRAQLQSIISPYRLYSKTADLSVPGPANTWIFCDESMYSLNDGYLEMKLNSPRYADIPAAYDIGGNCFSFADAHVEYRKWVWPGVTGAGLRNCPYAYGVTFISSGQWQSAGTDMDWVWLRAHSSALQ